MPRETLFKRSAILRDVVYSANDGVVTVFAVIAGSMGASFDVRVIIILGFANLFADGFAMATGNYLGIKSQQDYEKNEGEIVNSNSPFLHATVTFVSFAIAGFVPLVPFLIWGNSTFLLSSVLVALVLFVVGAFRSIFTNKGYLVSGIEMLLAGGLAALMAFLVGFGLDRYVL